MSIQVYDDSNIILSGIQHTHSYDNHHHYNPEGDNDVKTHGRKGAKSNVHHTSTKKKNEYRMSAKIKAIVQTSHLGKSIDDQFDIEA
jgi:hypothetical protein